MCKTHEELDLEAVYDCMSTSACRECMDKSFEEACAKASRTTNLKSNQLSMVPENVCAESSSWKWVANEGALEKPRSLKVARTNADDRPS